DLERTPGQRRHDALAAMADASRSHDGVAAESSLGTTIVCDHATYLVALARILAALRGDDPDRYRYPFERRCEFADGTPVTPEQAVWASIAGWIAVLAVDERGHPLNYSRRRRFFTGAQRDAAIVAFPTCDDPTCPIRSVHCQIDHLLEWIDGGPTDAANGRPLCRGHNLWKEHQRARNTGIRSRRRRTPP
ncbi:MAG: HNH endonuclease, partial [Acidimicrobiales bacterium]|nr:HNH endonuclease [Acidimicrobiales bacterium]